ncbi:hypothetical protein EON80_22520 [bacterium]|nr:MAG: hypothetical protein EON80_22520 [bacterium]
MITEAAQVKRLIFWNRFWLTVVVIYTIIGGYKALESKLIQDLSRLQMRLSPTSSSGGESITFSSNFGGPFIITHLVTSDGGEIHPSMGNIAELPKPLLLRSPKGRIELYAKDLDKLKWYDPEGKPVKPPRPITNVMALYSELKNMQVQASTSTPLPISLPLSDWSAPHKSRQLKD